MWRNRTIQSPVMMGGPVIVAPEVFVNMELLAGIRRRVLTHEISKRACRTYETHIRQRLRNETRLQYSRGHRARSLVSQPKSRNTWTPLHKQRQFAYPTLAANQPDRTLLAQSRKTISDHRPSW